MESLVEKIYSAAKDFYQKNNSPPKILFISKEYYDVLVKELNKRSGYKKDTRKFFRCKNLRLKIILSNNEGIGIGNLDKEISYDRRSRRSIQYRSLEELLRADDTYIARYNRSNTTIWTDNTSST